MQKLERIFNKTAGSNQIYEAVLFVQNTGGDFSYSKGHGGRDIDSPLLMASITKLFTTSCILALQEQGRLSLDDGIAKYFDKAVLEGLHVYKGKEYSFALTISDLLFQVSGLPDVYEEGNNNAKNRVINEDFYLTFNESVEFAKKLNPHFAPHTMKRAHYADINFDMLGEILEKVMGLPLSEVYKKFIFEPVGLKNTYLPESENNFVPKIYYKDKAIHRPKFVMSSRASSGCVTTARELMIFIKAFFGGELFDKLIFDRLSSYNKLQASMWPICYGGGYMRIPLNGVATFFRGKGEIKGHSGSTGSFAFYYPVKDLFFVGDLNQMANAALPIKLSMRIAMTTI
ncbi:serine hydrolase domain-containing protein [Sporotomaculum syntrophicum]|nr:serine hydrolase domain-containing protein [Sporotomaculum syntrophicum]